MSGSDDVPCCLAGSEKICAAIEKHLKVRAGETTPHDAAGAFLRPDEIDVALDFQSLAAIGATFGSGAIMVMDDTADLRGVLKRIARFFKDESCGKCFPRQIGTQRQLEIITRMVGAKHASPLLHELGATMRDASLCGLGQTASSAIDKGMV